MTLKSCQFFVFFFFFFPFFWLLFIRKKPDSVLRFNICLLDGRDQEPQEATQRWVAVTKIKGDESWEELEGIKLMGYAAVDILSFLSFLLVISATDNYYLPSVIIFLYQSVVTMLQIKKLAAQLNRPSIGKEVIDTACCSFLKETLTLPKARWACLGTESQVWCLPGLLSPEVPSLPWNNLCEQLSARLDHCTTDIVKCCNLRWREESGFLFSIPLLILVWYWISALLHLKPQQQFSKGGCGTVLAPWLFPKMWVS